MNLDAAVVRVEELAEDVEAKRRFKPYDHYAERDGSLIDRYPSAWRWTKVKYLGEIRYGLGEPPDKKDDGLAFIRATDIHRGKIDGSAVVHVDPKDVPWKRAVVLQPNDILVVRSGAYTGDSAIVPTAWQGAIAGYDMVLRVKHAHPPFVAHAFLSRYVLEGQIYTSRMRAAQPHLNAEELGSFDLLIPPLREQRAIATFLDRETKKIDELIAKKERLIELLQEKRTALISQAVTKGFNRNASMKQSGLDWLGEVPAHWQHRKLGYIVNMQGGSTPSKNNSEFWHGTIPWVSPKDMKRRLIDDSEDHISETALDSSTLKLLPAGVVLMVVRGMILAHTFPVALTTAAVTINQDMKALSVKGLCSATYLAYLLQGLSRMMLGLLVEESAHGTKVLRTDVWKGVQVFLPPPDEQDTICREIEKRTKQITDLTHRVADAINRLREYRTALISAAVTGKIDVREGVA